MNNEQQHGYMLTSVTCLIMQIPHRAETRGQEERYSISIPPQIYSGDPCGPDLASFITSDILIRGACDEHGACYCVPRKQFDLANWESFHSKTCPS